MAVILAKLFFHASDWSTLPGEVSTRLKRVFQLISRTAHCLHTIIAFPSCDPQEAGRCPPRSIPKRGIYRNYRALRNNVNVQIRGTLVSFDNSGVLKSPGGIDTKRTLGLNRARCNNIRLFADIQTWTFRGSGSHSLQITGRAGTIIRFRLTTFAT